MIKRMMKSEGGFGLLEAMVILVIASIAIAGLFLASIYARAQAVENYHYRSALLHAAGQLEYIKWFNAGSNGPVNIYIENMPDDAVIDAEYHIPMKVDFDIEVQRAIADHSISLTTVYDRVTVTAKWYEKKGVDGIVSNNDTDKHKVVLVEDYYYQYGGFSND